MYYLGIDLGTSSLKILLGDDKGNILGNQSSSFDLSAPKENYSEENPRDWLRAFDQAFSALIKEFPVLKVADLTLAFSGQMHSLVLINEAGKVIRPAILWNDNRTSQEVAFLQENYGNYLLEIEKNIPLEGFTLPKILWVKKNEPQNWRDTWKFMLPKDYLIYYLTGKVVTEPSDAAGTIIYDIENDAWDEKLLNDLNIDLQKCPKILASDGLVGQMLIAKKEKFGLNGIVNISLGGADNSCGALGNITDPVTQGLISVGTSGVVLAYANQSKEEVTGKYHYFNSLIKGKKYKMGVTLSAGYSLNWLRNTLATEMNFKQFTQQAEKVAPGSEGLLFLPYLFGERSPYFSPQIKGGFIGLRASHQQKEMIHAVLEGVTFSLKNVYQNMEIDDSLIKTFRITGGVVKNPFWLQMFADVFNKPIEVLSFDEGPAYGALLCSVRSESNEAHLHAWKTANQVKQIFYPNQVVEYQAAFHTFKRISNLLAEEKQ